MIRLFLVSVLMTSFFAANAHAEEVMAGAVRDESKEAELAQRAKKRLYPGGRDEGDLKVQAQVTNPTRKLAPQAEIQNEEPAEE
ncbi:hypothetical protein B9G69_004615 [Bdellovibrio sp. SKB1291214]|uniref:hypothetical protein n=1 Tax=Bdellovibrio sp. SKB1291214 TaxID=1732569 RepID=UPI000B5158F4|nr:hypothetical protein [Bdellovibrio sp. SKB1291214]UYL09857.1 hypothetical protein B9G69_004615 [Bdellovibrio sp. SKB1291214]